MRLSRVDFPAFGFPTTVTIPARGMMLDKIVDLGQRPGRGARSALWNKRAVDNRRSRRWRAESAAWARESARSAGSAGGRATSNEAWRSGAKRRGAGGQMTNASWAEPTRRCRLEAGGG